MKRLPLICSLILAFGALGIGAVIVYKVTHAPKSTPSLPSYARQTALIGGERVTLLMPETIEERQLGLGAVAELPKNHGMVFRGNDSINIWMKGMRYPIDIIWLDDKNTVIHVVDTAKPDSYPETTYMNPTGTDARAVVELNAGEAKRLNVRIGTTISL